MFKQVFLISCIFAAVAGVLYFVLGIVSTIYLGSLPLAEKLLWLAALALLGAILTGLIGLMLTRYFLKPFLRHLRHELKGPLSVIVLALDFARRHNHKDSAVQDIEKHTVELEHLIDTSLHLK